MPIDGEPIELKDIWDVVNEYLDGQRTLQDLHKTLCIDMEFDQDIDDLVALSLVTRIERRFTMLNTKWITEQAFQMLLREDVPKRENYPET